jgi:ubiquinone/menaquinone biosynthesis C-methylase UbiE
MWDVEGGIVAREVAGRAGVTAAVTGVDLSSNMLAVARAAADREGLTIEWRKGNAERLLFTMPRSISFYASLH